MSLSGKSTLANNLAERLRAAGRSVELIDADELASVLAGGQGTNKEERNLVTRRIGYVARLLTRNDCVAVAANTSPYRETRDALRKEIGRFIEVFVDCPTEKLMERDTSGRYKKALAGQLPNFIGVTDPYETPQHAEAVLRTDLETVEESAAKVFQSLYDIGYLKPHEMEIIMGRRVRKTRAKAAKPTKAPPKAPAARAKAAAPPKAAKPAPKAAKTVKEAVKRAKPKPAPKAKPAGPAKVAKAAKPKTAVRQPTKAVKLAKGKRR
jgi:adenylylsulfate kinase